MVKSCIYKYQASDQLIAEVMNYYAVEAVPAPAAMLKKKVEIIGIYSPVGRSLKTSLALTYGQIRAREHKVLYLNLEEYAGFETLLEEKYEADLADLLYFARLGSGNLVYRMGSLTAIWEGWTIFRRLSVPRTFGTFRRGSGLL